MDHPEGAGEMGMGGSVLTDGCGSNFMVPRSVLTANCCCSGNWSIRPISRSTSPLRPEIVLSSRVKCPNNGTAGPRGLIGAQNSDNVGGRTFCLGYVSLGGKMKLSKIITKISAALLTCLIVFYPSAYNADEASQIVDISSKDFTEDFIEFSKCAIVHFKLFGIYSERLDLEQEHRDAISEINFGFLDEGRLYEMNYEHENFYDEKFLEEYLRNFDQADEIFNNILRDGVDSISDEHKTFLFRKMSNEKSVTLGIVQFADADLFHSRILNCNRFSAQVVKKYR